jgi:hypothetical protein
MRKRKLKASTLRVGWVSTNRLMLPEADIMKITAMTMAMIMMSTWSAIPIKEADAADHRQSQARHPGPRLPALRKFTGQNGDEDAIVDPQDDYGFKSAKKGRAR